MKGNGLSVDCSLLGGQKCQGGSSTNHKQLYIMYIVSDVIGKWLYLSAQGAPDSPGPIF